MWNKNIFCRKIALHKITQIARAYGAEGHRLTSAEALLPVLEAAIASG